MSRSLSPNDQDSRWRTDPRVERSREAGLEAARGILHEEGFEAVTHTSVAQRSGLNRATIYRHWPDRTAILRDLLTQAGPPPPVPDTGDLRSDLVDALSLYRDGLVTRSFTRLLATAIDRAQDDPDLLAAKMNAVNEGAAPLRSLLDRARSRGDLPKGFDPGIGVAQLFGPLIYRHLCSGEPVPASLVVTVVDQFLAGYRPEV